MHPPTSNALCAICSQHCPIYTCPRCATRTCSLPCSKSHKELQSCSGERNKASYVPMNKYGWGTMANDYVYLEDLSRKATEWGDDIVRGGFLATGHRKGQGRDARSAPRGGNRSKREILKAQLDALNIEMEMLPPGMNKRRLNQSTWDVRMKSALMTIEFVFHPAKDMLVPCTSAASASFTLLTHRNNLDFTIVDTIRRHIGERTKKDAIPSWVKSLVSSADEENFPPSYLTAQHLLPSHLMSKVYHKLEPTQSLLIALCHKSFVEYPTIHVPEDDGFNGVVVDEDGTLLRGEELRQPPANRRRLDIVEGQKMIKALLGDYHSDGDQDDKGEEENVLDMLGDYGSEEEPADLAISPKSNPEEDHDDDEGDMEEPSPNLTRECFADDTTLTDKANGLQE